MILAEILSEYKEETVGVYVSGPRTMRQEVAAICSSFSADNLHFESISFSYKSASDLKFYNWYVSLQQVYASSWMLITNLKKEDEHQLSSPESHKNKRKEKENTRRSICRISKPSCLSMTLNSSYLNQTKTIKHCGLSFSTTYAPLIQLFPSGKSKKQWTCLELKSPPPLKARKKKGI